MSERLEEIRDKIDALMTDLGFITSSPDWPEGGINRNNEIDAQEKERQGEIHRCYERRDIKWHLEIIVYTNKMLVSIADINTEEEFATETFRGDDTTEQMLEFIKDRFRLRLMDDTKALIDDMDKLQKEYEAEGSIL